MKGATVLAPETKPAIGWDKWPHDPGQILAWEVETTPRLQPSDLSDPSVYYRRLEDWLMKQK